MKNQIDVPVVFATDTNYVPILLVAIKSLYLNTARDITTLHVFILTEDVQTVSDIVEFEFPNCKISVIDMKPYIQEMNFITTNRFSKSAYYRIFIPKLFSEYKKVIYLDCDIVVCGDIRELYSIDLRDNAVGCICDKVMLYNFKDYLKTKKLNSDYYFNSGVMVFDTRKFQQNHIQEMCNKFINGEEKYSFPDQDILNLACNGFVYDIPESWNYQWHRHFGWLVSKYRFPERLSLDQINLIHYTSEFKPWVLRGGMALSKQWWKYYSDLSAPSRLMIDDFRKRERVKFIYVIINRVKSKIKRLIK